MRDMLIARPLRAVVRRRCSIAAEKLGGAQATLFAKQIELNYQAHKHLRHRSQQNQEAGCNSGHATCNFTLKLSFAQAGEKQ